MDVSSFRKAIEESQKKDIRKYCYYSCSKYCERLDWDMNRVNGKYCCNACYNGAKEFVKND